MKLKKLISSALFAATLAFPPLAGAATVTSLSTVNTFLSLCDGSGPSPICLTSKIYEDNEFKAAIQGASATLTKSSGVTNAGQISTYGDADLSSSKLRAAISAPHITAGSYSYLSMASQIGDTFTLKNNDGSLYGATEDLVFHLDVTGSLLVNGDPNLWGFIQVALYNVGYFDATLAGDYRKASELFIDSKSIPIDNASSFPVALDAVFETPNSEFEWVVSVFATSSFRQSSDESISLDLDLGHTVAVSFAAPNGVNVNSASGFIPPLAAAVPEPSNVAMVVGGLFLALAARKKKFIQ